MQHPDLPFPPAPRPSEIAFTVERPDGSTARLRIEFDLFVDRLAELLIADAPQAHRMLADHLTSEYRVPTTARGRTVEEWKLKPGKPDNHWLDCLVGCAVAASMQGSTAQGTSAMVNPVQPHSAPTTTTACP